MDLSSGKICVVVLLVTLLPAAVLSCEGTRITGEADQQTRIPCTFTGDMRNLYWFYQENEGMERKKVLTYFKQELTYHGNYTSDHVQLDVETSTLVIMSVSIADEGIYTCDVDRLNQTAALDIVSCLDVFATPSKPFPQITECNAFGQDETCNLFSAETETNITCILSGFYPDGKATLEWLHQDLTSESSVQEDETYILTIRSTVPREGNYTCEASYVLPNGTVTTGRKQVFFKEMEGDEEVKNAWSTGQIAGVTVAILTAIIIIIITIWMLWGKRKRKGTGKEKPSEKDHVESHGQPGEGTSSQEEMTRVTDVSRRQQGCKVTGKQIIKLSKILPPGAYRKFSTELDIGHAVYEGTLKECLNNYEDAFGQNLHKWADKTGGFIDVLDKALKEETPDPGACVVKGNAAGPAAPCLLWYTTSERHVTVSDVTDSAPYKASRRTPVDAVVGLVPSQGDSAEYCISPDAGRTASATTSSTSPSSHAAVVGRYPIYTTGTFRARFEVFDH
ncbi:uncharacterized protein [Diadema setosum]|uniref:uncharacterized protein n=1 Tax=Diadema setosum TaxID=31175 RepID=UPI003B3AA3E1